MSSAGSGAKLAMTFASGDAAERVAGAVLRVEALAVHERQLVEVQRLRPRARRVVALQRAAAADPDVEVPGAAARGASGRAAGFAAWAGNERQAATRPRARTLMECFHAAVTQQRSCPRNAARTSRRSRNNCAPPVDGPQHVPLRVRRRKSSGAAA